MTALSLYSGGCDGLSLAAGWVGIKTAAFCECDEACREQIDRRHPGKPVFHYDTEVTRDGLRANGIDPDDIDIILASPPCQCASVAGKRLGAADQRNRWPQCLGILRDVRPPWFLGENVPGLLSVDGGRLFADILGELAEMGYDAGWCVYGVGDIGAPHQRDRLCIVAYRHDQRQPQPEGGVGDIGRRAGYGGELADAHQKEHNRPVTDGNQTRVGGSADSGYVGDTGGAGLPITQQSGAYQNRTGEWREWSHGAVKQSDWRPVESGLGELLNGISRMLAAHRWPAGRGEPQHDWEPYRTVKGMKGRAALIKMLGNAVVPQWAVVPLAVIVKLDNENM